MWRLITFIIIFALFLGFIFLNLGNVCAINFGFREFSNVPIFISCFSAFILGMLFAVPFIISAKKGRKKSAKETSPASPSQAGGTKKRWGLKKKASETPLNQDIPKNADYVSIPGSAEENRMLQDEINKDKSAYGID